MKANEFVKKFGWDEAQKCLPYCSKRGDFIYYKNIEVNFNDLKRLVESWELVESTGMGFNELKNHLNKYPQIVEFNFEDFGKKLTRAELKQAIADVESCQ